MLGDPIGRVGRWGVRSITGGAGLAGIGYLAIKAFFLEAGRGRGLVWRTFLRQVYFTAAQAIPLLTVASLSVGVVVFSVFSILLEPAGLSARVQSFSELLLRELMPLITVLVIIGRSGTAMATELGTMKINREDEVLDSLAINLDYFVIFPRVAGMIASLLVLNLFVYALSIVGGEWLSARLGLLPSTGAWPSVLGSMERWDLPVLAVKSVLFGAAVSVLACYHGLSVQRSPTEVPKVATRAVITSIFICLLLNFVCSMGITPTAPPRI